MTSIQDRMISIQEKTQNPKQDTRIPLPPKCNKTQGLQDRFIPSRKGSEFSQRFALLEQIESQNPIEEFPSAPVPALENYNLYNVLLQNQLLGVQDPLPPGRGSGCPVQGATSSQGDASKWGKHPQHSGSLVHSRPPSLLIDKGGMGHLNKENLGLGGLGAVSTLDEESFKSFSMHKHRKVPKTPYKVLDAPNLQDDFYVNLLEWSPLNILGVGLSNCAYLWNSGTGKVHKLTDLADGDLVTSLSWNESGNLMALGTFTGAAQIWDLQMFKQVQYIIYI